jgi:hypothetical protein
VGGVGERAKKNYIYIYITKKKCYYIYLLIYYYYYYTTQQQPYPLGLTKGLSKDGRTKK